MSVKNRLEQILEDLKQSSDPIPARKLAEKYSVSRQVIVGDIALLRARGEEILSTPKGYLKNTSLTSEVKRKFVCKHTIEETTKEIDLIIHAGGRLLDVSVEHPVYGEITGTLNIFDKADADNFNQKVIQGETSLLLELTEGLHMHTIAAESMEQLDQIEAILKVNGFLYSQH